MIDSLLTTIEEPGPNLGKSYVGTLGSGLYEIRAKGKEGIGRSMYCVAKGKEVVILHSIIKKTQKTPKWVLKITPLQGEFHYRTVHR